MKNSEKQAAYRQRLIEKGLVQILEWVPSNQRETFRRVAAELRAGRRTDRVKS